VTLSGARLLDGAAAVLRGLGLLCVALIVGLNALAAVLIPVVVWLGRSILWLSWQFGCFLWFWLLPALGRLVVGVVSFLVWRLPGSWWPSGGSSWPAVSLSSPWRSFAEARTSYLEALLFSYLNQGMNVALRPGPSQSIRFPDSGPYDERLGYRQLPDFIASLDRAPLRGGERGAMVAASRQLRPGRRLSDLSGKGPGGA